MPPYLRVDVYGLLPHHISKHTVERLRRPLELDHLARELVDPARHIGITPEDLALYLLDIVLEPVDYGSVIVYDTSIMACRIASGPRRRCSGSASSCLRTPPRSGASPWRTLTTKSSPTKRWTSPNSTLSSSSR